MIPFNMPVEKQIKCSSIRIARFVRDDPREMQKDLEIVGWIAYLEHQHKPAWWLEIKKAMFDALSLWLRGVTWPEKKDRKPPPVFVPLEEWTQHQNATPETWLLAKESFQKEASLRDSLFRPLKKQCRYGHPLSTKQGGRKCNTCRERSREAKKIRNRKWRETHGHKYETFN
jgi:hypothetical protein